MMKFRNMGMTNQPVGTHILLCDPKPIPSGSDSGFLPTTANPLPGGIFVTCRISTKSLWSLGVVI